MPNVISNELQDLARRFDALPGDDIESRVAVAVEIERHLGARRDEFDRRYTELVEAEPTHGCPAVATLLTMELCSDGPGPREP